MAEPIDLKTTKPTSKAAGVQGQAISTLPFAVDVTFGHLTLHMKSANSLCMVVAGPDGVVLVKEIQAQANQSTVYDLTRYRDGNYQVRIIDAKGNDVSGAFFKQMESLTTTDADK